MNLNNRNNIKGNILVIDDDEDIIFLIDNYFSKKGFTVIGSTNGEDAIKKASKMVGNIDIILLDILMPEMDGYQILYELRNIEQLSFIPIVILTSYEKKENKIKAYELGADDFIQKPFDELEMEVRIRSLLRIKFQQEKINKSNKILKEKVQENLIYKEIVKNTIDSIVLMDENFNIILTNPAFQRLFENKENILGKHIDDLLNNAIKSMYSTIEEEVKSMNTKSWQGELIDKYEPNNWVASSTITPIFIGEYKKELLGYVGILHDLSRIKELESQVLKSNIKLKNANMETVFRLSYACDARDEETGLHIKRIGKISELLAKKLDLSSAMIEEISYSSMLHDVGKIRIPDSILKKPGKPTLNEWEILKKHTLYGEELLGEKEFFKTARKIARSHHEKWNGTGYPDGLKGEEIPLEARITAIADVYDALTHKRVYKEAWSKDKAYNYMIYTFGSHFDPSIKDIFSKLYNNGTLDMIDKKYKLREFDLNIDRGKN